MVTANHDIRPKTRKQKAEADDKALLISQSQSNTSLNGLYTLTPILLLTYNCLLVMIFILQSFIENNTLPFSYQTHNLCRFMKTQWKKFVQENWTFHPGQKRHWKRQLILFRLSLRKLIQRSARSTALNALQTQRAKQMERKLRTRL